MGNSNKLACSNEPIDKINVLIMGFESENSSIYKMKNNTMFEPEVFPIIWSYLLSCNEIAEIGCLKALKLVDKKNIYYNCLCIAKKQNNDKMVEWIENNKVHKEKKIACDTDIIGIIKRFQSNTDDTGDIMHLFSSINNVAGNYATSLTV